MARILIVEDDAVIADGLRQALTGEGYEVLVARDGDESSSPMLFCGDVDASLANRLTERFAARAVIASPAMNARRAGFIAELAWARFRRGESDDVAALAPMYAPFKIQTES